MKKNWMLLVALSVILTGCGKSEKAEAEKNLVPSLKITAMVNGREVPAIVKFSNGNPLNTQDTISDFTENEDYEGQLTYQSGEDEYEGTVDFTCNWRGPKEIAVALKKMEFSKINLPGNVKLEMVKVKKGNFTMSKSDGANYSNEVEHDVTLHNDFYIGKYEVTQAQWNAIMPNNPSNWKGNNLPVEQVTWHEAMEFCSKLNQKGLAPSGWKFTLPTESQWEYAAHGGHKRTRYYKYSGSDNIDAVAWYGSNSSSQTHPVGQKKSNDLGLHDMSGNVWEWCLDNYKDKSNDAVAEFSRDNDSVGSSRVLRGGSWSNIAGYCRSAYRYCWNPEGRYVSLGFRLALVPVQ